MGEAIATIKIVAAGT